MYKECFKNFDFADSEYVDLEFHVDCKFLIVTIKNWQERYFKIKFIDTIKFEYQLSFQISTLIELTSESCFAKEESSQEQKPSLLFENHKQYQFIDIDDFPFIRIFANSAEITECEKI